MGHFRALPGASRAAGATLNSLGAAHTAVSLYIRLYSSIHAIQPYSARSLSQPHSVRYSTYSSYSVHTEYSHTAYTLYILIHSPSGADCDGDATVVHELAAHRAGVRSLCVAHPVRKLVASRDYRRVDAISPRIRNFRFRKKVRRKFHLLPD